MSAHMDYAYVNPFPRNHCAVHAFEHVRTSTPCEFGARSLAKAAYDAGILTHRGVAHVMRDIDEWCRVARVRVAEAVRFPLKLVRVDTQFYSRRGRVRDVRFVPTGPTVTQFARGAGAVGRWVVVVAGHVLAVVDGQPRGIWRARSRVYHAYRMEAA